MSMASTAVNKRFTFGDTCDVVLVLLVDSAEAHLASYSSVTVKWKGVRVMFLASHVVIQRIKERRCNPPT